MVDSNFHIALKVEDLEQSIKYSNKKIMTSFLENPRQGSNCPYILQSANLYEDQVSFHFKRLKVEKAIVNV